MTQNARTSKLRALKNGGICTDSAFACVALAKIRILKFVVRVTKQR